MKTLFILLLLCGTAHAGVAFTDFGESSPMLPVLKDEEHAEWYGQWIAHDMPLQEIVAQKTVIECFICLDSFFSGAFISFSFRGQALVSNILGCFYPSTSDGVRDYTLCQTTMSLTPISKGSC